MTKKQTGMYVCYRKGRRVYWRSLTLNIREGRNGEKERIYSESL